jgi:hypothetical protein
LALHVDFRAMGQTNGLHNRKSQARTAVFARACFINSKESIKYMGDCGGWDAHTGIRYLKDATCIIRGGAKRHRAPRASEANSVIQKIHDDLFEPRSIP